MKSESAMQIFRNVATAFEPAGHEKGNDPGCLKKVLVRKADVPEGRLQMVNWVLLKPNRAFEAHYHERMTELFIIIAGRTAVQVDGHNDILLEGDALVIPPGAVHTMTALDGQAVHYLAMGIVHAQGGRTIVVEG